MRLAGRSSRPDQSTSRAFAGIDSRKRIRAVCAAKRYSAYLPRYNCFAMKISLGADHAGFELKEKIKQQLAAQGITVDDRGTGSTVSVDYPDFARAVAEEVAANKADLGILVCSTGIGMSIAANKVPGVRAAKVDTEFEAERSREHNDANVLTLGADTISADEAMKIVNTWLKTPFSNGERHERRVQKIAAIEREDEGSTAKV